MTNARTLSVDAGGIMLRRGGQPFFSTADTPWCAFMRPSQEEWEYYLRCRAERGCNVLQLSLLPVAHEVADPGAWTPFESLPDGSVNLTMDDDYLLHAVARVSQAAELGFTCAIALLWVNYVPHTWAANADPRFVLSRAQTVDLVCRAATAFAPYDPVYFVSGDTDFPSGAAAERYRDVLETVKAATPHCLTAFHTQPARYCPNRSRTPKSSTCTRCSPGTPPLSATSTFFAALPRGDGPPACDRCRAVLRAARVRTRLRPVHRRRRPVRQLDCRPRWSERRHRVRGARNVPVVPGR